MGFHKTSLQQNTIFPVNQSSFNKSSSIITIEHREIISIWQKESQKLLKYMLKKHYIDYLGTDIHRDKKTYVIDNFKKIEKQIIKITKENYYEEIKENNNSIIKEVE